MAAPVKDRSWSNSLYTRWTGRTSLTMGLCCSTLVSRSRNTLRRYFSDLLCLIIGAKNASNRYLRKQLRKMSMIKVLVP